MTENLEDDMIENFMDDILEAAQGERIEAIVIGPYGGYDEWSILEEYDERIPLEYRDTLIDWTIAKNFLDYEYSTGYGGAECHAIYAWTPTRVLFVVQYDGSTKIKSISRNPVGGTPEIPGG
uniref:Uncharacterized protein n=1 Tax=viral metagenome TaxID=1070528 RepID=A0A6H1ZP89_9ZZZZ